ncbi:hypothetical protein L9F63_002375, partial [Diploptera punctata]
SLPLLSNSCIAHAAIVICCCIFNAILTNDMARSIENVTNDHCSIGDTLSSSSAVFTTVNFFSFLPLDLDTEDMVVVLNDMTPIYLRLHVANLLLHVGEETVPSLHTQ